MKEKIIEILSGVGSNVDFANEKSLIDDGLINSLEIMKIISELENEFDIEIGMEDIIPENFDSVDAIADMVSRLKN